MVVLFTPDGRGVADAAFEIDVTFGKIPPVVGIVVFGKPRLGITEKKDKVEDEVSEIEEGLLLAINIAIL